VQEYLKSAGDRVSADGSNKKAHHHQPMLDFDYPRSIQPHIPAPSRLLILTMSMMDSDLKKRAEKAASIRLAAPFLVKVPQAICVDGADNKDADDGAADDDADDDADVNADDNTATQTMDDGVDNDAARRG
jgi:hypothetical protein